MTEKNKEETEQTAAADKTPIDEIIEEMRQKDKDIENIQPFIEELQRKQDEISQTIEEIQNFEQARQS